LNLVSSAKVIEGIGGKRGISGTTGGAIIRRS